jgi:flagellar hook assembly protein FlgD
MVFGGLVVATLAAFFISQHLKVTTPFISGLQDPHPAVIDPAGGPPGCRSTTVSFFLLHHVDNVDVDVVNQTDAPVRSLAHGVFMRKKESRSFTWDGRTAAGQPAPAGTYFFRVYLIHQARSIQIPQPVTVKSLTACPSKP